MTKCRWCDEESVGVVEVEPARYGLVQGVDRQTGRRATARVITRRAILAEACATHAKVVNDQPQSMVGHRRKHEADSAQTSIFEMGA